MAAKNTALPLNIKPQNSFHNSSTHNIPTNFNEAITQKYKLNTLEILQNLSKTWFSCCLSTAQGMVITFNEETITIRSLDHGCMEDFKVWLWSPMEDKFGWFERRLKMNSFLPILALKCPTILS